MIELTDELRQALSEHPNEPIQLTDPKTSESYILIPAEVYERLTRHFYDDSEWTDEEMDMLAAEAGEMLDNFGKNP